MVPERSLTEQLAAFLAVTETVDMPKRTVEHASRLTLDWLASAIAGTQTGPGRMVLSHAAEQPRSRSSVIGLDGARSTQVAAFANGALSHITETDDVHRAAVLHPGTVVIPAALAVSEHLGRSGLEFLTAVALGYEVAIRVGESVGASHYGFWHNTSTCGVFGSAAAAGWLLGLSPGQMTWALGNAGSLSAGLWEFNEDGAMAKHLHAGHAASSGVLAAELAARGFTGTRSVLEGRRGLYAATSSDAQPDKVTSGLAVGMSRFKIEECSVKPYPSCRHTHAPVDLAFRLRQAPGLTLQRIERIEVGSYRVAVDLTDNPSPTHEYAAKFSTQYCVAIALHRGRLTLKDFVTEDLADPAVLSLISRTSIRVDPEIEARYPEEWCARLTITTTDGEQLRGFTQAARGDPENPLSLEELRRKFRSMVTPTPYGPRVERLIEAVADLARSHDIRALL